VHSKLKISSCFGFHVAARLRVGRVREKQRATGLRY